MNQKKSKALRRAIKVAALPPSKLEINRFDGAIRQGWGARAAYQRIKHATEEQRKLFVDGLTLTGGVPCAS